MEKRTAQRGGVQSEKLVGLERVNRKYHFRDA
jgi:hypothetical protein